MCTDGSSPSTEGCEDMENVMLHGSSVIGNIRYGSIEKISNDRLKGQIRIGRRDNPVGDIIDFNFCRRRRILLRGPIDAGIAVWSPVDMVFRSLQLQEGSPVFFEENHDGSIEAWAEWDDAAFAMTAINAERFVITHLDKIVWQGLYSEYTERRIDIEGHLPPDLVGHVLYVDINGSLKQVCQRAKKFSVLRNANTLMIDTKGQRTLTGRRAI